MLSDMRTLLALALTLTLTACDEEAPPMDMAAVPAEDLATPADLSAAGEVCLQVVVCASNCAGVPACVQACTDDGSPTAQAQFQALFACAYGACLQTNDASAPACASMADTSASCQSCITAAVQGPTCASELAACLGI